MKTIRFILCLAIFTGCTPFVEVIKVEKVPSEERNAAFHIKIYGEDKEFPDVSSFYGQVTATSCKGMMTDPPATSLSPPDLEKYSLTAAKGMCCFWNL